MEPAAQTYREKQRDFQIYFFFNLFLFLCALCVSVVNAFDLALALYLPGLFSASLW
jgi:hypothetical protein